MNPAISAATTINTIIAAQAAAHRKTLVQRIQELPPSEATRERVLEGLSELEPVLDAMLHGELLRLRADGTLRYDAEHMRAQQRRAGKVALLILASLVGVASGALLLLLLLDQFA